MTTALWTWEESPTLTTAALCILAILFYTGGVRFPVRRPNEAPLYGEVRTPQTTQRSMLGRMTSGRSIQV